eukprot:UN33699
MNHQKTLASKSNKYSPALLQGFYACISSRITTIIQLQNTIKETITDIMSRPQFQKIFFILTHAWLNL